MKTRSRILIISVPAAWTLLPIGGGLAGAQTLYVTNLDPGSEYIQSYPLPAGGPPDGTTFANTGLGYSQAAAISNGFLYVTNGPANTIEQYALTGPNAGNASATVFASAGLDSPDGLAIANGILYVSNFSGDTIEDYQLTGPNAGNASAAVFATSGTNDANLHGPTGIAIANGNLYVGNEETSNSIEEYSLAAGNSSAGVFATQGPGMEYLRGPFGLATYNGNLYVSNTYGGSNFNGTIEEYSLATGNASASQFASTGLDYPYGIGVYNGALYVANEGNSSIEQFALTGPNAGNASAAVFAGSGLYEPEGLAINVPIVQLTWNNSGGASPSDGKIWDISNNNWNNGSATTVYTDGSNVTFNDNNNNHYAVTLNSTVSPGSVTFSNNSGNYTISGTGTIGGTGSLTKSGSGTVTLSTANAYSGGTNVSAGLLVIEPTSSTTSSLATGALTISGGEVKLATNVTQGSQSANTPVTAPLSNVNITSLSIAGSGTLDIGNNHIVINYGSGTDPIGSIATWIADGAYGNGTTVTWTGTGIIASPAQANPSYGIGYADSADPGNPAGLSSGQIEIMYTLLGDANLDGKVNGTDFNLMATNFNQAVTDGWDRGDFNYDGKVNGNDFVLLADNFNQFASQSAVSAADLAALDNFAAANGISLVNVPEPGTAGLLLLAGLGRIARRRRHA